MVAFMSAFFVTCARDDVTASRRNLVLVTRVSRGFGRWLCGGGVLEDGTGEAPGAAAPEGPEQFQTRRFCEPQRQTFELEGVGPLVRRHRQDGGELLRERPYACAGGRATHFLQILGGALSGFGVRCTAERPALRMKYKRAAEIVMRKRAATEGSSWARGHHKCGNAHLLRLLWL